MCAGVEITVRLSLWRRVLIIPDFRLNGLKLYRNTLLQSDDRPVISTAGVYACMCVYNIHNLWKYWSCCDTQTYRQYYKRR